MILWITGNMGAGKTTLALPLAERMGAVLLDGDLVRAAVRDWDMTEEGRRRQVDRVASLAFMLSEQGFPVVVSVIAPYLDQRRELSEAGVVFWYMPGGHVPDADHPYEPGGYDYAIRPTRGSSRATSAEEAPGHG